MEGNEQASEVERNIQVDKISSHLGCERGRNFKTYMPVDIYTSDFTTG